MPGGFEPERHKSSERDDTSRRYLGQGDTRCLIGTPAGDLRLNSLLLTTMPSKRRVRKVDNENAEDDSKQHPTKSRFVRGKRGGLESLPRMPLDIIIEVTVRRCFIVILTPFMPDHEIPEAS